MASFRITPVKQLIADANGKLGQVPVLGTPLTAVTIATAAATSSAVNTPIVELYAEADCYYDNHGNTATSASHFMAAGERLYVGHKSGNTISVKNTA